MVIYGLSKFSQYIGREPLTLITDSKALTYLMSTKNLNAKLARWAVHLSQYHFDIVHKAGKCHTNADGLSRMVGS